MASDHRPWTISGMLESCQLQEAQILSQIRHWAAEDIWSRKLQAIETKQGAQSINAKKTNKSAGGKLDKARCGDHPRSHSVIPSKFCSIIETGSCSGLLPIILHPVIAIDGIFHRFSI